MLLVNTMLVNANLVLHQYQHCAIDTEHTHHVTHHVPYVHHNCSGARAAS